MLHTEHLARFENNRPRIIPKSMSGGVYGHYVVCKRTGVRYRYYRRQWYERGQLHKQYVRLKDLDAVSAACAEHRRRRIEERAAWSVFRQTVDGLRRMGL